MTLDKASDSHVRLMSEYLSSNDMLARKRLQEHQLEREEYEESIVKPVSWTRVKFCVARYLWRDTYGLITELTTSDHSLFNQFKKQLLVSEDHNVVRKTGQKDYKTQRDPSLVVVIPTISKHHPTIRSRFALERGFLLWLGFKADC